MRFSIIFLFVLIYYSIWDYHYIPAQNMSPTVHFHKLRKVLSSIYYIITKKLNNMWNQPILPKCAEYCDKRKRNCSLHLKNENTANIIYFIRLCHKISSDSMRHLLLWCDVHTCYATTESYDISGRGLDLNVYKWPNSKTCKRRNLGFSKIVIHVIFLYLREITQF